MQTKAALLLFPFLACAFAFPAQTKTKQSKPAASAVEKSSIIIDTHADTPQRFVDENFDMATNTPVTEGHMDFGKAKQANLGAEFFSIWVDPVSITPDNYTKRALDLIDSVYQQAQKHPNDMVMAFSAEDIVKARRGPHKRLAALMGVEGGHAIENDIHVLDDFYRLGVRYMTLSWSNTNEWADSSGDIYDSKVQHHNGLTDFGKQVVLEMNRLGMMVDISHVADKTFWDAIQTSKAPVIASHSSARALTDVPRNMTDDMLRAVAKNGGVVDVNFNCGFVSDDYNKREKAFTDAHPDLMKHLDELGKQYQKDHSPETKAKLQAEMQQFKEAVPPPPLSALVDHFDHIAKVAGIDHVGLGSDFDGVTCLPAGIDSVADVPKITQALLDRGYTSQDLHKILGGNLLRVFRDVERVSREMQTEQK